MWRTILATIGSMLLALTFLGACLETDEQRGAPGNDQETEEATSEDDQGAARTDEQEDQPESQTSGEQEGEDGPEQASGSLELTLVDYEIQGVEPVQAGIITFQFTNEGEHEHGIAVEPADGGEVIGMLTAEAGGNDDLELELQAGEYNLFCPVGDHRDAEGMETQLTVE